MFKFIGLIIVIVIIGFWYGGALSVKTDEENINMQFNTQKAKENVDQSVKKIEEMSQKASEISGN